jgi:hypothetical protein
MELLDIILTKGSMPFTVSSTGGFAQKAIVFSGFKNPYKRKLGSIHK